MAHRASLAQPTRPSPGKDKHSGHWEIAGCPSPSTGAISPEDGASLSEELTRQLIERSDIPGILGNCHASGTDIIERLGQEHIETGKPIC